MPPLPRRATKQLLRCDRFTAFTDAMQPGEPAPSTETEYTAKVAQLLAHATYHFPNAGVAAAHCTYIACPDADAASCTSAGGPDRNKPRSRRRRLRDSSDDDSSAAPPATIGRQNAFHSIPARRCAGHGRRRSSSNSSSSSTATAVRRLTT